MAKVLTWWSEIAKTLNEELRNEILSLRKMFKILLELNFYSSEMWDCFPNFEYLWNQLYAIRPLLPASKWLDSKSESVLATRLWSTPVWCVLTCLVSPGALVRPVSNRCVGDLTPHFKGWTAKVPPLSRTLSISSLSKWFNLPSVWADNFWACQYICSFAEQRIW